MPIGRNAGQGGWSSGRFRFGETVHLGLSGTGHPQCFESRLCYQEEIFPVFIFRFRFGESKARLGAKRTSCEFYFAESETTSLNLKRDQAIQSAESRI
jgi:hypothetical protein